MKKQNPAVHIAQERVGAGGLEERTYLDHGTESLVAMDNPDDSRLELDSRKGIVRKK